MKTHRLNDQNLLRHQLIQERLTQSIVLVSDSAPIIDMLLLLIFNKKKYVLHILELYSISLEACISEYKHRWATIPIISLKGLRSILGFVISLSKVSIFVAIANRSQYVIVSSSKRAEFLVKHGAQYRIEVLKNKPIYKDEFIYWGEKQKVITVVGNMYSQYNDFMLVYKFALQNDYKIICYGLTNVDKLWLEKMNLSNVFILDRLDQAGVADALRVAQYSLCFYPNSTVNNILSASSKIFEILCFKVMPIITKNEGLIFELECMSAPYVLVGDLNDHAGYNPELLDRFDRSQLFFSYEL